MKSKSFIIGVKIMSEKDVKAMNRQGYVSKDKAAEMLEKHTKNILKKAKKTDLVRVVLDDFKA